MEDSVERCNAEINASMVLVRGKEARQANATVLLGTFVR